MSRLAGVDGKFWRTPVKKKIHETEKDTGLPGVQKVHATFGTPVSFDEKFYKLAEVEKILSASRSSLKRWISDGTLKAVKFGIPESQWRESARPWRISATALREFEIKYKGAEPAAEEGAT